MYRDRWIELFEPIFYGAALLMGVVGVGTLAAHGDWLGLGFLVALPAMCVTARVVFFRPHLVIGDTVLVLAGVLRTRRIAFADVERAVATQGALKLCLRDGDEVYVPGHFWWHHASGDAYWSLASMINARLAAPATGH